MKLYIPLFLLLLCGAMCFARQENAGKMLQQAKAILRNDTAGDPGYEEAAALLVKVVQLEPGNAEAHYFLGHAYSRINMHQGETTDKMELPLAILCSEEFETVNRLTPEYKGEYLILDPYSKITSGWASMALSYLNRSRPDSAAWALKEGKKRGGFGALDLSLNRIALDRCSKNSWLLSYGDLSLAALLYMQLVENYRKDVTVIDLNLLATQWYPAYLSDKGLVDFGIPRSQLGSIDYREWQDSTVTIHHFSWTVPPTNSNLYLTRPDLLVLSALKKNDFRKDIYFTNTCPPLAQLGLHENLLSFLYVDKVNTKGETADPGDYYREAQQGLAAVATINPYCREDYSLLYNIRYNILKQISVLTDNGNKEQALALLGLMDRYVDEKKYPLNSEEMKQYMDQVRAYLSR